MEKLFNVFNQKFLGKARIAVIGGEIRNNLAKKNQWHFPDLTASSHLDVLVILSDEKKQSTLLEILDYFQARPLTDICHIATVSGRNIEFVGVVIKGALLTSSMVSVPARPDLTIERFGYYNDWSNYDESGRGFEDFFAKTLSLMNDNLFLQKYLKILSLKFQTGFAFDSSTAAIISQFEDSLTPPKKREGQTFAYNHQLFKKYGSYDKNDPHQIGIHVALLYLRAQRADEVTDHIESHKNLRNYLVQTSVNYRNFESQIKRGDI